MSAVLRYDLRLAGEATSIARGRENLELHGTATVAFAAIACAYHALLLLATLAIAITSHCYYENY